MFEHLSFTVLCHQSSQAYSTFLINVSDNIFMTYGMCDSYYYYKKILHKERLYLRSILSDEMIEASKELTIPLTSSNYFLWDPIKCE